MDDETKIKVLKIYYDHWGGDELWARKVVYGLKQTLLLLTNHFQTEQHHTLEHSLRRMFYCMCNDDDVYFLWTDFADILLQDFGGCFEPILTDGFYDEEEILFDRKIILEENLNISNDNTADMIFDNNFSYKDTLSVDAIVALPIL